MIGVGGMRGGGGGGFDKVVSGSLDEVMPAEKSASRYQDTDNITLTFSSQQKSTKQ